MTRLQASAIVALRGYASQSMIQIPLAALGLRAMQAAMSAGKGWAVTAAASGVVNCLGGTCGTLVIPHSLVLPVAEAPWRWYG